MGLASKDFKAAVIKAEVYKENYNVVVMQSAQ